MRPTSILIAIGIIIITIPPLITVLYRTSILKDRQKITEKTTPEDTGIEYVVRVNRGEDTGEYYIKIQRKRD